MGSSIRLPSKNWLFGLPCPTSSVWQTPPPLYRTFGRIERKNVRNTKYIAILTPVDKGGGVLDSNTNTDSWNAKKKMVWEKKKDFWTSGWWPNIPLVRFRPHWPTPPPPLSTGLLWGMAPYLMTIVRWSWWCNSVINTVALWFASKWCVNNILYYYTILMLITMLLHTLDWTTAIRTILLIWKTPPDITFVHRNQVTILSTIWA